MASKYHDCTKCGREWTHKGCLRLQGHADTGDSNICPKCNETDPTLVWQYIDDEFTAYVKQCRRNPKKALNEIID
jgi:hypothetical protein